MNKFIELTKLYEDGTEKKLSIKVSLIESIEETNYDIYSRSHWNKSKDEYNYEDGKYTFECYDDYYKFMRDVMNKGTRINFRDYCYYVKESYEQVKQMISGDDIIDTVKTLIREGEINVKEDTLVDYPEVREWLDSESE